MKDFALNNKINSIREQFNDKLNDNMKLSNNKYRMRVLLVSQ